MAAFHYVVKAKLIRHVTLPKNRVSDNHKFTKLGDYEEVAFYRDPDYFDTQGVRFGSLGFGSVSGKWH